MLSFELIFLIWILVCSLSQDSFQIHAGIEVCLVHVLDLVYGFAGFQLLNNLGYTGSMKRIALKGCIQIACDHGFKSSLYRVKAYYDDVAVRSAGLSCCLDCIDSAESFVVILADNYINIIIVLLTS